MAIGKKIGKFFSKIGKKVGKGVKTVGKEIGKGLKTVRKGAGAVSEVGSAVIDLVEEGAKLVEQTPVIGGLAKVALDSPIGLEVQSVFKSAKDANKALKESIQLFDEVEDLGKSVAQMNPKDPKSIKQATKQAGKTGRLIKNSSVGKRAGKLPSIKKAVREYNAQVSKLESKMSREERKKFRRDLKRLL